MNRFITTRAAQLLSPKEAVIFDRIPFTRHVDPSTVATKDGLLVQTLHIEGFPFETASD